MMTAIKIRGCCIIVCCLAFVSAARADLLLFFDFNDSADPTSVLDASGNNNGAVIYGALYTEGGRGRSGEASDQALDFLGAGDGVYIEVPSAAEGAFSSIVDNDAATIVLWVWGGEFQPQSNFCFWFADGDVEPRQLSAHIPWNDTNIYFDVSGCCEDTQRLAAGEPDSSLWKGQWNHYAFVKDGQTTRIYQNGTLWLDSGENLMAPLSTITTVRFGSGQAPGEWSYNGLMDDIGVWDEALTEEEIQNVMLNGIGPEEEPLFLRGDSDADRQVSLTDAVITLRWLFQGGSEPPCLDASDGDDNGVVSITDAVAVLNSLFLGTGALPAPGPAACGLDPTADTLACSAICK